MVLSYFIKLRDSRQQVKSECAYWLFAVMLGQAHIGPGWPCTCLKWKTQGSSGEDLENTINMISTE